MNTTNRDRARELRKNLTDTERLVWAALRGRRFAGFKFRRQMPLGPYIVDFVCLDRRLVLELDGGQHTQQAGYDQRRTDWLRSQGFRVIRFWNHEVLQDWETVAEVIWRELQTPLTPDPSPTRGEGRITDIHGPDPSPAGGEGRITDTHASDHFAAGGEGRVTDILTPDPSPARGEGRITDTCASDHFAAGGEGRVTDIHAPDHSAARGEERVADTSPPSREGARGE